ncbi:MAG TPA: trp RNA-binding attenuation protein MtrB [Candidatus Acidoferrales bacterium]|nr:trp RNA-binding attenuation protein MtrB [Candidatus Acidoferrales bacterium]
MERDDRIVAEEDASGTGGGRYVVVKALQDGVVIMGLTRGRDTRSHHSERLDTGEVLIAQFTGVTAAIKVRGKAEILTEFGRILSD